METKYIFVGGKGGVGKTSISSALALADSSKRKVLLVSTDPVFALSDLWGVKLTNKPKRLRKNLFAKHINPDFFEGKTTSSPCASEKATVGELSTHLLSSEFDEVIFDTAPTGHTLLLLRKPQEWKEFIEKTPFACGAEEGEEVKYEKVIEILKGDRAFFIFVVIPESLSIQETKRAVEELKKIGITNFSFVVNMVIPLNEVKDNRFLQTRLKMQKEHIRKINKLFGCCPQTVYLQDSEIKSEERLKIIANQLATSCCV